MKKIFYNENNLRENDINNIVKRAKMIIMNSNDEILLGYGRNTYQIPGGHVEENESFSDCVVREIKEEIGINISKKDYIPFLEIKYYCKDYPNSGINSCYINNYYYIKSDLKPNLNSVNLTENEKEGLFEIRSIALNKVIEELNKNLEITKHKNTVLDTINAIKEFINLKENNKI